MITQYHRPRTLEEAQKLLERPNTRPLGGGTLLTQTSDESFSVVDLQALGLDKIKKSGNFLSIGATVTLQALLETMDTPAALKTAIEHETPLNLRTMGTVAGTLVTCDGASPFGTTMLALDAKLVFSASKPELSLGNYLPLRQKAENKGPDRLIMSIQIPLNTNLAFESLARTPGDRPIVCAALCVWPSGRRRLALGGWGLIPTLAMDGNEEGGLEESARQAFSEAGDEWASTEYRMEMAGVLAKRCNNRIGSFII